MLSFQHNSLSVFKLQLIEFIVITPVFQQLLMISSFDNLSVLQDDDLIGMLDRRQTMCHHQHCPNGLHLLQRLLNQHFRLRIDIRRRLIENQDLRLMNDRTGKG